MELPLYIILRNVSVSVRLSVCVCVHLFSPPSLGPTLIKLGGQVQLCPPCADIMFVGSPGSKVRSNFKLLRNGLKLGESDRDDMASMKLISSRASSNVIWGERSGQISNYSDRAETRGK